MTRKHRGKSASRRKVSGPVREAEGAMELLKEQSPLLYSFKEDPVRLAAGLEALARGVGKPWKQVRLELERVLDGSPSAEVFASELCVNFNPVMVAGVPHTRTSDGQLSVPIGWGELYVDADDILREWRPRSSK